MYCPTPNKAKKGFTLVEVLMVLVIISIMAGLLITVINPVRQRARARDGTIIASSNKIIASIQAFNGATGLYPNCPDMLADLQNATISVTCTADEGSFRITGLSYPTGTGIGCDAASQYGSAGASECNYHYERSTNGAAACLGIKMHSAEALDDDTDTGQYLLWTSGLGRLIDEPLASGGTCNCDADSCP